ncbi:MAG: hypothetical protein IH973_08355 [Myxococcales bacterium]|nr:hypothetical protein [Myxococcales bacterium]
MTSTSVVTVASPDSPFVCASAWANAVEAIAMSKIGISFRIFSSSYVSLLRL